MPKITSRDGTPIAYNQVGQGPAVILIDGAMSFRAVGPNTPVAPLLAPHFTVITFDRRGRGESGDTAPYTAEREIEDVQALVATAGGSASLYGISSGAVLALLAAARTPGVRKLAMYEPPFVVDASRPPVPEDFRGQLANLLERGERGEMVERFLVDGVSVPAEYIPMMRQQPSWAVMEGIAHTLVYDVAIMGASQYGRPLAPDIVQAAEAIKAPALVMAGGASPAWLHNAAHAVVQAIPGAQFRMLEGQTHGVAPEAIAPVLDEFFKG